MGLVLAYFAVRSVICYHHLLADVLDLFVFFVELISYYLHTKKNRQKSNDKRKQKYPDAHHAKTVVKCMPVTLCSHDSSRCNNSCTLIDTCTHELYYCTISRGHRYALFAYCD